MREKRLKKLCLLPVLALAVLTLSGFTGGESSAARDWTEIPVFAHALGMVEGRAETNSREAFLESYARGQRVFEADLQLTSDGYLVCRHDWDQTSYYNTEQSYAGVMDLVTFLRTPINYRYTPLDADGLVALLLEHPDAWLVTDSKETGEGEVRAQMRQLALAVARGGDESLWDRIIVQIYHDAMYDYVRQETPVKNWIYTLYQLENPDYAAIGAFCRERNIPVVTMALERVDGENTAVLHRYGRKVYAHTVNRIRDMVENAGYADGFYSDLVTPGELEAVTEGLRLSRQREEAGALRREVLQGTCLTALELSRILGGACLFPARGI